MLFSNFQQLFTQPTSRTRNSTIMKYRPMSYALPVISSILFKGKIYITGVVKDRVLKSRLFQLYIHPRGIRQWSTLPEAPSYNAPIMVVNGQITMIGGHDSVTSKPPNQGQWRQILPSIPTKQVASVFFYHHGHLLLVTGGAQESAGKQKKRIAINEVDVYNFNTMKWTSPKGLQLPKSLQSSNLLLFGDNIYLC